MASPPFIPVSQPSIGEREIAYVTDAVRSGWVSSLGRYIEEFERGFAAFCGTRHALATRKKPDWDAMVAQAWVLPPRMTRVRTAVEALFRRAGAVRPRVLAETLSLDLILELLAHGAALAVLPQQLARRLAVAGQARILDVDTPGLVMPVSVFTLAGAPMSTTVDTFKDCLIEAAALR